MGDFFKSDKEKAGRTLYDMAMGGKTPYDAAISGVSARGQTAIDEAANYQMSGIGGDLLSQLASMGIAPGASFFNTLGRQKVGIASGAARAKADIVTSEMQERIGALADLLKTGYSGLSATSPAGNVMGGLMTLANLASGVATMGGSGGFQWFGGLANPSPKQEGSSGGGGGGYTPSPTVRDPSGAKKGKYGWYKW